MMEDVRTEFKREWKKEYLRNVAALANTDGGTIHVGIADDGTVYGLKDLRGDLKQIPDDIQNSLGIVPVVDHYVKDDKDCIEIRISKSNDAVFYNGKIWVKSGSTTRVLSGSELRNRLLKDSNVAWVDVPIDDVQAEDLSVEAVSYFLKASERTDLAEQISESDIRNVLAHLDMIAADGRITRAAVLLFHPEPWRIIRGAYMMIGEFSEKNDLIREEYVRCSLIMMPDRARDILFDKFTPGSYDYSEIRRKVVYKYPPEAVREILTNSIIHKDYSISEPITVKVYADKMSVYNFGALPDGWTVDDLLKEHASVRRNYLMAEAFHEAGYIEKWGKGIGVVIGACKDAGIPEPVFDVRQNGLNVTFSNDGNRQSVPDVKGLTDSQRSVLDAIRGGCRTRAEISSACGLSDATVKRAIGVLIDSGLIRREGAKRSGSWVLKEE